MFLEKAVNGENQFWRYLVSVVIIIAGLFIGQIPLGIAMFWAASKGHNINDFVKNMDFSSIGMDPNVGLILVILSFAVGLIFLFLSIRFLHKKSLIDVISGNSRIRWKRIFFAFFTWLILSALAELGYYFSNPAIYSFDLDLTLFIPLVFIAFILLPFQTSFEEIFIRGYLMQGIGLIARYSWIPLLISSIIFGTLHWMNPEVAKFGLGVMMFYYISFGIFMAVITIIDDGLELALGIHAANNIYASVFVSYSGGALQTNALFKIAELNESAMVAAWVVIALLFLLISAKKFQWNDWGKLVRKIEYK